MNYQGKLYGKIGRKHFPLEMTAEDVDKLIEENKQLRENAAEVFIREMHIEGGNVEATFNSGIAPIFAHYVRKMMEAGKAQNFVSVMFTFNDELEKYYMTMGKCNGLTIQERYNEACSRNSKLSNAIENILKYDGSRKIFHAIKLYDARIEAEKILKEMKED